MKKVLLFTILLLGGMFSQAQFSKATLQASGLTCSMCNNAIYKALKALPFVAVVKPDIKKSSFEIMFKDNVAMDIDAVRSAVEDAGFSVAVFKVSGFFNRVPVENDRHVVIGGKTFHFLSVPKQVLNGERELTIVDKGFVVAKEFKKISKMTAMDCVQTGKAGHCCQKDGIAESTRIYHVTI